MVKTQITKVQADWTEMKNRCRTTVGKDGTEKEPSKKFILDMLIAEHSPIRGIRIGWIWNGIKSWVATHFARHWIGWDKWISTQRTDRTGTNRDKAPQDTPVIYEGEANPQSLINVARFRLCFQASPETRQQMEDLKISIKEAGQEEIAHVMQKNCVYRCGCPEQNQCGYWKSFCEKHKEEDLLDIRNRYKLADEDFYKLHKTNGGTTKDA